MVQRKLGLQANLANPIKGLASQLKPSSSLKEGNKKIKKSRSMKLSNLETPKSSSSSKKHDSELPNYMKATSSSVAKQPQVSPNIKKHGSGSCNKQTRTLTKSSSFKSVRTLTKSPSFKLARASSSAKKKRSGVALCADIDSQKATCSSTLKDSKFPDFLELSHGGTEAEGTSMVKVCPYLYCSLNGHHHKPSPPPLKMFLKAKRRVLKSQRSSKKIETESISRPVIIDEKLGYEDVDADMEYYVEIYAKNKVFVVDDDGEDMQVAESLSDGSPKSEIDFEEGLEEIKVEDEDEDCFESESEGEFEASMDKEETQMGRFCFESESEGEFEASMDVDEEDSEAIGVDKGATFSIEIDDLSYLKVGFSMEAEDLDVQGGLEAIEDEQSDDTAMEATTPASEEIAVPHDDLQLEDDVEACNGDEESEGDMDHHQQQETELEAINEVSLDHQLEPELEAIGEVAQNDTQLEDDEACNGDEESEAALAHHHQQETELEAIGEVAELISSNEALDHHQETELEAIDEGALDHHQQETELEAIDEVAEPISSEGALDHQQETESEPKDELKSRFARAQSSKSHPNTDSNTKWSIGRKRSMEESEEESEFNPREPTFLPLIPDPEAEKVDLRHQMIDERKNSDEWMLDYALQRTVTKLAPARKRKVALLVEAFESVLPVPRYHQNVAAFAHVRPIQACN